VKSAGRQTDRCRNIQPAITVKVGHGSKDGGITYTVPLVRTQAAVRVGNKDRHVIRRVVKHDEIRRSVAVHVARFQVVADSQIFQYT
jgi:hypothetical protein